MLIPVILSGGSGTRLWPLSRKLYPKQFLPLAGENTMFQMTVERAAKVSGGVAPLVVCNEDHRFLAAEQLRQLDMEPQAIVLEPIGRNTAPATAVAAFKAAEVNPDALVLVLPADHVIEGDEAFAAAVAAGKKAAEQGYLVTFGVTPTGPETGYGYINMGEVLPGSSDEEPRARNVAAFVEKPNLETAQKYVDSGAYAWNAGIFLFKAQAYLDELARHVPSMVESCKLSLVKSESDLDFTRLDKEAFTNCVDDSIDYAVMEKTDKAAVVPLSAAWSDLGSWKALWEVMDKDEDANVLIGDAVVHDTTGTYIRAESRLIAAVGVTDTVIVETKDAILVAPKDRVQDVKAIVNQLKVDDRTELAVHRKNYRPWGAFEGIDTDEGFQVKRITVNPGATLSLQMHHHRAEHWIVVRGTALVTKGDEEILVSEDQSTYIPLGTVHRLNNPGKIPLELIEVQTGSYLGEDDIVRFEDVYGRKEQKTKY
ncbi:MAG: mannose-1-phosphate guanylyltransferase/mannose-6-phosphate isomerase [Okeania sp. SIO3B3]|nr:mannose-1-phosphate guanylyltransferase/mannose-6-phosphate isomerase [Okeania sp. SIO3B3]